MVRKVLIGLLALFIIIQFIRPEKNITTVASPNAINKHYQVPADVQGILKQSCYDCHSNNTYYPWYNTVQPIAWLLSHDVNEGKRHFNFDEFKTYTVKKQQHKLEELTEQVKEGEMPMSIYTLIHRNAILSATEKQRLIAWADSLRKAI